MEHVLTIANLKLKPFLFTPALLYILHVYRSIHNPVTSFTLWYTNTKGGQGLFNALMVNLPHTKDTFLF